MPGLSVVDNDNDMELTGLRQASLTFKHTDFQGWRDNPDWTTEKIRAWYPGERARSLERDSQAR
jgi:hypothetical protein